MSTFQRDLPRGKPADPKIDVDTVSNVGAAIEAILPLHGATIGKPGAGEIALLPTGIEPRSLKEFYDEWRDQPERRRGTATFDDIGSFIAHTNRFKDIDSAVFCRRSESDPRFTSVLDYHRAGPPDDARSPRWGQHRGVYQPKVSEAWAAWKAVDGKPLKQAEFAALLEDRILDIAPPPEQTDQGSNALIAALGGRLGTQSELLTVSRGLRIRERSEVTNAQVLESGEVELVYKTELRDATNAPLRLPTCFCVAAPVFEGGPTYRLWVRIRFRHSEGVVIWTLARWRPDLILQNALDEMMVRVRDETSLPVLLGSPE